VSSPAPVPPPPRTETSNDGGIAAADAQRLGSGEHGPVPAPPVAHPAASAPPAAPLSTTLQPARDGAGDVAPADEAGVAEAVRAARGAREPFLVVGAGTKLGMLRPVQAARALSTRNLTGITLYAPKELIVSARAGTPVAVLEAALAEQGQHLIAEPPDLSALLGQGGAQTLGGVVATNLSGPRRVAWGAMRDHVMGVRAVNGDGEVFHSGGRVLKNVTGLDLCKLLAGSHGTLGVLTEITLKVLPAPEQTGTLVLAGLDAATGVMALSAALGSPYGVSGAAWLPAEAAALVPELAGFGSVALVRIEDFAASVAYRTGRLALDLAAWGQAVLLDDSVSRSVWRAVRDVRPLAHDGAEMVWRVSVRPSSGASVLAVPGVRGFLDWGGGLVWLVGPVAAHGAVAAAVQAAGGIWTVMQAPEGFRAAGEMVPPEPPVIAALTRRVKAVMDPGGILNPGRVYAGV
jgi:glycolate oxidase FAD binding subunit